MSDVEQQPVTNIVGTVVALGPLRTDVAPLYHRWENDLLTSRNRGIVPTPRTLERVAADYRAAAEAERAVWFTIYELPSWQPIGLVWLTDVEYRDRTATLSIFLGETELRGRGYGTEATRMILEYAFSALGLHNVMLIVAEFNRAARRAYEKAGFQAFGTRRQSYSVGGRLWDDIYMECLASEFVSPVHSSGDVVADPPAEPTSGRVT